MDAVVTRQDRWMQAACDERTDGLPAEHAGMSVAPVTAGD